MAEIIKAPERIPYRVGVESVFLAGSIDMGTAENWQEMITGDLSGRHIQILNPRRDDWDSTWEQSITNPEFYKQVSWEMAAMERATVIALYFAKDSLSPISLLELGLHASSGKIVIFCPDGFWRKGNVEIIAEKYRIPIYDSYHEWLGAISERLNNPSAIS